MIMQNKLGQELCRLAREQRRHLWWLLGLGALAALLLGKYLFTVSEVLSREGTDTFSQFIYTYALGFDELSRGHLTLWNPYVYGGQPFLGQFQTGILYPVNWLFMWLPIATALNWIVFAHTWLMGAGVYGWAAWRGCRSRSAFLAGAAAMLGGPYFLHIYSGHIPHLSCMALAPLVFWGIDGWLRRRHLGWIFLSATAAALQIYAGHPQYFYYTAIVSGLYALVFLCDAARKQSAIIGLLAIYPLAVVLSAAQLLPGLAATGESVRSGGADYAFATMFALPWENFLTLLAPWFFGDMETVPYWGKCYLWEMQLYCGLGTLLLAVVALWSFRQRQRVQWAILLTLTVLLALGARTPLYDLLYNFFPGYNLFRGTSKFSFLLVLFVALLAAHGFDRLLTAQKFPRWPGWLALGVGAALLAAALTVTADGWLGGWARELSASRESYAPRDWFNKDANFFAALTLGRHALLWAAAWALAAGGCLLCWRRRRWAAWLFAALTVIELSWFAASSVTGFALEKTAYRQVAEMLQKNPGDYRALNLFNPEASVGLRSEGLWGYDPFVLKRYAEFVAFTQGVPPDAASQNLTVTKNSPLLALLRAKVAFVPTAQGLTVQPLQEQVLPRFFIVSAWRVVGGGRDAVLAAVGAPSFDPRQEVILEEDPLLPPDHGEAQYQIRLLNNSTDHWTLEVVTTRSSLLVMTDAFSKDWRVTGLPGSVQTNYHLLPADYALRAIPLAPGRHVIRVECAPRGFAVGWKISALTLLALTVCCCNPQLRRQLARFTADRAPNGGNA
jgi:hypothetical protein